MLHRLLLFIALLTAFTGVLWSANPTWSRVGTNLNAYQSFASVAYGSGVFVAAPNTTYVPAGGSSQVLALGVSEDGITWEAAQIETDYLDKNGSIVISAFAGPVRHLGGQFLVTLRGARKDGVQECRLYTSNDGRVWAKRGVLEGAPSTVEGFASDGAYVLAAGFNNTLFRAPLSDLSAWTALSVPGTGVGTSYLGVAHGNGRWLLFQNGAGTVWQSTDGSNFSATTISTGGGYRGAYGNGVWYLNGQSDVRTSTDGVEFTTRTRDDTVMPGGTHNFSFAGGRFFGLSGGLVADGLRYSENGVTWAKWVGYPAEAGFLIANVFQTWNLVDAAYGEERFVAVGMKGIVPGEAVIIASSQVPEVGGGNPFATLSVQSWSAVPGWGWHYGLGGGWALSLPLGSVPLYTAGYPWIYHPRHGYLYAFPGDLQSGRWFYSLSLGYLYTHAALGGWMYHLETASWIAAR